MKNLFVGSIAFAAIALAMTGCRLDGESETINTVYENTIMACSDGIDNDGNGLVDCEDPGCQTKRLDGTLGPAETVCATEENNIYTCSDGKDNNGNGFIDCEDNSCKNTAVCCVAQGKEGDCSAEDKTSQECIEEALASCSDGIDNDCNGHKDCDDYACKKNSPVAAVIDYCKKIKCPGTISKEGDCSAEDKTSQECIKEALESCADGKDNDCNDYTDCGDFNCSKSAIGAVKEYCLIVQGKSSSNTESPEYKAAKEFFDKSGVKAQQSEDTEDLCSDGIDNDWNGLTDCDEPGCKGFEHCKDATKEPPPRPANFDKLPAAARLAQLAAEFEACSDGEDNDKNGRSDCDEYQCHLLSTIELKGEEAKYQIRCHKQNETDSGK